MSNTLKINFKGRDEREQALINTVNALVDMVCNTRLPQTQKDIQTTNGQLANIDETNKISFETLANGGQIDEQTVLEHKETISEWSVGVLYKVGQYVRYLDVLYKTITEHTSQSDWTPDIVPSLYSVINVAHAGTIEDPIPAVVNMEYVKGLYYIEDGVIYLMNREGMADGESITLAFLPSQLVGHYFEVVDVE